MRYYELEEKYSKQTHEGLVKHVKKKIKEQILKDTKSTELNEEEQTSLNLLTWENLPSFLLQEKGYKMFNLCEKQDWPFIKACDSVTRHGQVAFIVDIPYSSWKAKDWQGSPLPEGVPSYYPNTKQIHYFIKALKHAKCTGYLVDNTFFTKKDYYRRFAKKDRKLIHKNDGWYSRAGRKQKQPKREQFYFWCWEESVCNLIFYFFFRLY